MKKIAAVLALLCAPVLVYFGVFLYFEPYDYFGLKGGAVLRLKRLRMARSGQILGRSDEALEAFHDIKTPTGRRFDASAALAPDGRSLCILRQEDDGAGEQPHALHLTLQQHPQTDDTSPELLHLPLPEILARRS